MAARDDSAHERIDTLVNDLATVKGDTAAIRQRLDSMWTPQQATAVVSGVLAVLAALGFGGPRMAAAATALAPAPIVQEQAVVPPAQPPPGIRNDD